MRRKADIFLINTKHHAQRIATATLDFIAAQLSNEHAPKLVQNTAQLLLRDTLPLFLIEIASHSLLSSEDQDPFAAYYVINAALFVLAMRQRTRFFAHNMLLTLAYPKQFYKSSLEKRRLTGDVCLPCSPGRKMKGDVRSLFVFFVANGIEKLLRSAPVIVWCGMLMCQAISSDKIKSSDMIYRDQFKWFDYLASMVAGFFHMMLYAQVIAEYALSHSICDRHRMEFYHQYYELFFALGFFYTTAENAVSFATDTLVHYAGFPSLDAQYTKSQLQQITLLYFIGMAHHIAFPPPVEKATRHFYDVLAAIRWIVDNGMDLLIPGIKKVIDEKAKKKKDKKISWLDVRYELERWITSPLFKCLSFTCFSSMYRNETVFLNDFIVRQYWQVAFEKIIFIMETLERSRSGVLAIADFKTFYDDYLRSTVLLLSIFMPMGLAGKFISVVKWGIGVGIKKTQQMQLAHSKPHQLMDKAKNILGDLGSLPNAIYLLIIAALRDERLMKDIERLKTYMKARLLACRTEEANNLVVTFEPDPPAKPDPRVMHFDVVPTTYLLSPNTLFVDRRITETSAFASGDDWYEVSAPSPVKPSRDEGLDGFDDSDFPLRDPSLKP